LLPGDLTENPTESAPADDYAYKCKKCRFVYSVAVTALYMYIELYRQVKLFQLSSRTLT